MLVTRTALPLAVQLRQMCCQFQRCKAKAANQLRRHTQEAFHYILRTAVQRCRRQKLIYLHLLARKSNKAGSSRCTRSCSHCMTSRKAALRTPGVKQKQHLLTQRGDLLAQLRLDAATRAGRAWAIRPLLTDSGDSHRPMPRVSSPQAVLPCLCALVAHALARTEAPQKPCQ